MIEGYIRLGVAVTEQACRDYAKALKSSRDEEQKRIIRECERFFLSGAPELFCDVEGEELMMKLRKQGMRRTRRN